MNKMTLNIRSPRPPLSASRLVSSLGGRGRVLLCLLALVFFHPQPARSEALLQLFNVSWSEVAKKMPELAEAGYGSLWLPPPTKGSGGLSVGYDMWDPFDLGSKEQRGTVRTRYGTEAELLNMVETAHRFGIRVYFDNIMNHRAFDIPGYDENTPVGGEREQELYPGMVPEDFHLRKTEEGFFRKWDNTRDWSSSWQVQNLGLADLIDIAHETPNANFGSSEGSVHTKYSFVRDLERPSQYNKDKNGKEAYFGVLLDQARAELWSQGAQSPSDEQVRLKARSYILANRQAFVEDVGAYLIRAARWEMDRTKADGLRLDAVKHVPDYFFGMQGGAGKDSSDAGYLGGVQRQFNLTRGFSDANHRDTVFDEKSPRDDAMVFGEHLGSPPGYNGYWDAGMRLVDNELRGKLNGVLGNPGATLAGLDAPGAGGFAPSLGVTHANSHDSDYAAQKEWQHAFYMLREGMGLIYSDGFNKAETLGESGGAFPRHANTQFLGQFGDPRIPNILRLHNDLARGLQQGRWSDGDYLAFERRDNRNPDGSLRTGSASEEVTMVAMMNDNTAAGQSRPISTSFPSGAYLYQYAEGPSGSGMTGFYKYAGELGSVIVPPGGYYVFGYRTPEPSDIWPSSVITLHQRNPATGALEEVPKIKVTRRDGRDGDASFNPYGLANRGYPDGTFPSSYSYQLSVPVVKQGPVTILAHADGSAENILLKLDGGVDLNGTGLGSDPALRDNPPALRTDVFLGYEQPLFVSRQHPEKFAALDTLRCKLGSAGAETYIRQLGGPGTVNQGPASANDYDTAGGNVASWVFHDPDAPVAGASVPTTHFSSLSSSAVVWAKSNQVGAGFEACVYYTLDGTYPEGAGGLGLGTTRVAPMAYRHTASGGDWWSTESIPTPGTGSVLTYKIGYRKTSAPSWWPADPSSVAYKRKMLTTFQVQDFDPSSASFFPHNDYARIPSPDLEPSAWPWALRTGLTEGFHVVRGRAFLNRSSGAPIYQTFTQTFYYDANPPEGVILWPSEDGQTLEGSSYEVVVRTDETVEEVWFHIEDSDSKNNDAVTQQQNANGPGCEPFSDGNQNGVRDATEEFTDINGNGTYDPFVPEAWVKATMAQSPPGVTGKEWRFRYNNLPPSGSATVRVRLMEASSSRDITATPESSRTTELTRTVQTRGLDERVSIAWPRQDGDRVDDNYVLKVHFTKALAYGLTESQLIDRFSFGIASQSSGSPAGEVMQSRDNFRVNYDVDSQFHELAIPLPNIYNGVADFLHTLKIAYKFPSDHPEPAKRGLKIEATRLVTSSPSTKPFVTIVRPTEYGSDGNPTEIVLRDVPEPDAAEYEVQVKTSLGVDSPPVVEGISVSGSPLLQVSSSSKTWSYIWNITSAGPYTISATATSSGQAATATRRALVVLRQVVEGTTETSADDDDDGLVNVLETNPQSLPTSTSENWSNGEVHIHFATGKSSPTMPDTDGDGLSDGLEVGWRLPTSATDVSVDTNGDGVPNFRSDFDPPLYAVVENSGAVPGVGNASQGDNRTRLAAGSVTDPSNPDSDGDGLLDGVEDTNSNGWTDGDGKPLLPAAGIGEYATHRPQAGDWANNVIDSFETWVETSPTNSDSDGDGLQDGHGEDLDADGSIDGDTNGDRRYQAGEAWAETDPLNRDTDGDGLPDGWELQFGLSPLDNGSDNMSTESANDGLPENGASGDPDLDGVSNADELAAGSNPRQPTESGSGESEGSVGIGKFSDWSYADLLATDEYNSGGSQAADVYRSWNDSDRSRDIVAFSFKDGGAPASGGDGRLYFRIDFLDLAPNAWQGEVDAYILIDTGNPAVGERAAPNDVDIATDMGWEVAVAAYGPDSGAVLVDTQRAVNTENKYQTPDQSFGIQRRPFGAPSLNRSAWSSVYDAVEISVDRQALVDAGWQEDPSTLNFQVFTTKPYVNNATSSSPAGSGDLSGRNDIRDTIYDDWVASDYWKDQDNIKINERLSGWFGRSSSNDRNRYAKVLLLAHGNQALQPSAVAQGLLWSPQTGTGYARLLEIHEKHNAPLTLHITPTLSSSFQWAANPNPGVWPNSDGPSFNAKIRELWDAERLSLLGSTFSDHIPKYFTWEFNKENVSLANSFLDAMYGAGVPSRKIFWPPERVLDSGTLQTISGMGYEYAFADQMRHFLKWFGRSSALGESGYRVNRVNGLRLFPIHDEASAYLGRTHDEGSPIQVRELLSRRSRSRVQDQMTVLWKDMGDFSDSAVADSYEANVRWLSSRPWIRLVTASEIASGQVPYPRESDGSLATEWGTVERGEGLVLAQTAKDWIDHATQENYDNWYYGSGNEEGLSPQTLGAAQPFGQVGVSGTSHSAWLSTYSLPSSPLRTIASAVIHSSMFETAFHNTSNSDLSKFSTGAYINPDSSQGQVLAPFAKNSQSQARFAAVYDAVRQWASAATPTTQWRSSQDVDLDGAPEYILANSRIFALFESSGGRMTAAWLRDPSSGKIWQVAGNFVSYSGTSTEEEGTENFTASSPGAYRTSGFKDWWTVDSSGGSSSGVNGEYLVSAPAGSTSWKFSRQGISKTISLPNAWTGSLVATYELSGPSAAYVRFGLSPNLMDLLTSGHANLSEEESPSSVRLTNSSPNDGMVRASVEVSGAAAINATASDVDGPSPTTVPLRNQAQTRQVEVEISGSATMTLSFDQGSDIQPPSDSDGDGLDDSWEMEFWGDLSSSDGSADSDGEGLSDTEEFVLGSNPLSAASGPLGVTCGLSAAGFRIAFPTVPGRTYEVKYRDSLVSGEWQSLTSVALGEENPLSGTGAEQGVTDTSSSSKKARFYRVEVTKP